MVCGIGALALNYGAYSAEVVRSSIKTVAQGSVGSSDRAQPLPHPTHDPRDLPAGLGADDPLARDAAHPAAQGLGRRLLHHALRPHRQDRPAAPVDRRHYVRLLHRPHHLLRPRLAAPGVHELPRTQGHSRTRTQTPELAHRSSRGPAPRPRRRRAQRPSRLSRCRGEGANRARNGSDEKPFPGQGGGL
jgi:hypothetical protein